MRKAAFVKAGLVLLLLAGVVWAAQGMFGEDLQHVSGAFGQLMLGVRNDTLAALGGTDGDYVPPQFNASGALYVAETSGATIAGDTTAIEAALEASGWTVVTKAINVAAGATTELVEAQAANKEIRVVGMLVQPNVSGSITLKSAGTAISGVIPVAAKGGWVLPPIPAQNIPLHGWCETASAEALNITTVTCEVDGFLIYATED